MKKPSPKEETSIVAQTSRFKKQDYEVSRVIEEEDTENWGTAPYVEWKYGMPDD